MAKGRILLICLALAVITFAVFGQTLTHAFVDFDDNAYVFDNPVVSKGLTLEGVAWAFNGAHAHNWHPVTWLSHMADCQIYGLKPGGHHLSNLLLHAVTVILLFLLLRQMTGAVWPSAFVAAVFAIHPLRVESVAWVAERKDVLSGVFFLLTMGAYTLRAARGNKSFYVLSVIFFAFGLMSKPMVVTLPVVLLLLDYWPLRRKESPGKLLIEKLPFFLLAAVSCIITVKAQTAAIQSTDSYPLSLRLANALVSYAVYLKQIFYPAGLAAIYPYPHGGLPPWEVALSAILVLGISAIAWMQGKERPWLPVGWLWYLVMLLPALGIVQAGNQSHADRYTYLPQIGIYLSITWLAAEWIKSRLAAGVLMAGTIAALMLVAWRQTDYWKNSETLWSHALACTKRNDMAHYGMGNVYLEKKDWTNAATEYQAAIDIKPTYAEAHNNLGLVLFNEGKTDGAMAQFNVALRLNSDYADARFNLGNAFLRKEKWDDAIDNFQLVLALEPDRAVVHGNLGIALFRKGKKDDAIKEFQTATQLAPNDAETHYNLAEALRELGRADEAIAAYQSALRVNPDYFAASLNLGLLQFKTGKKEEAIFRLQKAVELEPDNTKALNTLAWVRATAPEAAFRDGKQAVQLAQRASSLAGGKNPIFLRTLAAALAETGKFDDARQSTLHAIDIVRAAGREDMAKDLEGDLKHYAARLPLRQ